MSSQSQTVPHPGKPSLSLPLQTEWRKHSLRENDNIYLDNVIKSNYDFNKIDQILEDASPKKDITVKLKSDISDYYDKKKSVFN